MIGRAATITATGYGKVHGITDDGPLCWATVVTEGRSVEDCHTWEALARTLGGLGLIGAACRKCLSEAQMMAVSENDSEVIDLEMRIEGGCP